MIKDTFEEACRQIAKHNLAVASSGNLSLFADTGVIHITPRGHWFEDAITIDETATISYAGDIIEGVPSMEWMLHLEIYRKRSDIKVILHSQPVYATMFCCDENLWKMDPRSISVIPEVPYYISRIGKVPMLPPGSNTLAKSVAHVFEDEKVSTVLMQSHGVITTGKTFKDVIQKTIFLELSCRIAALTGQNKLWDPIEEENSI